MHIIGPKVENYFTKIVLLCFLLRLLGNGSFKFTFPSKRREKTAVLLDFVQITHPPPPPPQFGQLVQLFKIQDLKVCLGLKIQYKFYDYLFD